MNWYNFKNSVSRFVETDVHPHIDSEMSMHFKSYSMESTEIEYLDLLYGIVRSVKPKNLLETGTFHGISTVAIAYALKENSTTINKPTFYSLEKDENNYQISKKLFEKENLEEYISLIHTDTLEFLSTFKSAQPFDLIYFDSSRRIRKKEFDILFKNSLLRRGSFLIFHDTSEYRIQSKVENDDTQKEFLNGLREIEHLCKSRMDFELSRGLTIFKF